MGSRQGRSVPAAWGLLQQPLVPPGGSATPAQCEQPVPGEGFVVASLDACPWEQHRVLRGHAWSWWGHSVLTALLMWLWGRRAWPAGSGQIPPSTGAEFRNRCLPHVLPFFNRKKKKKSPRLVPPHLKPRPCRLVLFDRSTEARASPRSSGVGRVCADISFYRSCITRMVLSGVVACVCHRCLPGRALASAAGSRLAPCGQPSCAEAGAVPVALSEPGDESLGFEWIDSVAGKAIPTD